MCRYVQWPRYVLATSIACGWRISKHTAMYVRKTNKMHTLYSLFVSIVLFSVDPVAQSVKRLRAGLCGIESQWGRDFPPVQTGPGAHPASCKMGSTHPF